MPLLTEHRKEVTAHIARLREKMQERSALL